MTAAQDVKVLSALAWPPVHQSRFLERWYRGLPRLPEVTYEREDHSQARSALAAVSREAAGIDDAVGD